MARKKAKPPNLNRNGIRIAPPVRQPAEVICQTKDLYRSRGEADAHALFFRSQLGTREPLRSYRCPACEAWHLTKREAASGGVRC
jgi:hypothetical protein